MRTQFVSVIRSRSFRMRLWIWVGVGSVLLVTLITGSMLWLAGHHLVKTDKGLVVVPKRFVTLHQTRVDIRGWTWDDAVANQDVSLALVKAGYSDLLPKRPPDPSLLDRTADAARRMKDATVEKMTNAWQHMKEKAASLTDPETNAVTTVEQ